MQNDPQLFRDLCKYQSSEIDILKRKLQACKCSGVKTEASGQPEELQRLRGVNHALVANVEDLKKELAELKNASTVQSDNAEVNQLKDKLSSVREKYKALKTSHQEKITSLEVLRTERDNAIAATEIALQDSPQHAQQRWREFLSKAYEPMSKQPKPSALRTLPKSGNSSFNMAKDAGVNASKCVDGTLILRYSEVIFPKSDFTHLVVTMPAFHFASKAGIDEGGCGWNKTVFPVSEGKTRDVFFHTKSSGFQYLGTYKCVVTPELAMRHVKTIEGFDSLHYGSIITRTAPSSPKCPKGLAKAVKALYKDDVLQVACVGLQCVGYDPDVNAALFSLPFKPSKVSDPGPSKKRKREGNSAGKGRSAKRSKKNSK